MPDNTLLDNNQQQQKKDPCGVWRSTTFVTVNYQPIYSPKLSALAKALWVFGHAHAPGWVFYFSEISKHFKESKRSLYRAFKELVQEGLAASFPYKIQLPNSKKWVFGGSHHWFFQEYMSPEKIEEMREELKKSFPCAKYPHAQNEHAQIGTLIDNIDNSKKEKKEYSPPEGVDKLPSSSTLSDPSKPSDADQLCEFLFKKIKEIKPNFTGKITPSGTKAAQKLLKLRSKKEIGAIIDFALKDEFWSTFCLSPGKILKHLDSLELQLAKGSSSPSSKSPIAKAEENKAFIEKIEKLFPQAISKGSIRTGYNYIQFIYGPMGSDEIKTSENAFKERVLCNLQKLNLPIKDLKE